MKDTARVTECESAAINRLPVCEGFVWSHNSHNAKNTDAVNTAPTKVEPLNSAAIPC